MKIEHIAMYVQDLESSRQFFSQFLMPSQINNSIIPKPD